MRSFYEKYKYRWEMTNEYGFPLSKEDLRDNRINQVFGDDYNINVEYAISLNKTDESGWSSYVGLYKPREKKLKIYPLSDDGNVRVSFIAQDIEECETYIDLVCKGNNMELMPVSLK